MGLRPLGYAVFVCAVLVTGVACAGKRVALVIADNAYRTLRPLENAEADAFAIKAALEKLDFEVVLETDRDLRRTRRALEDFEFDAGGADVALVYFAGHGVEIAGDNRLLPVDADAASLDTLKATTLPLEDVRKAVTSVAKVGLIVLDACRNDPFGVGTAGGGRGAVALAGAKPDDVKPGLGRVGRAENVLFAFSAAPGETASDGADGHSPFAEALIKYLGTDGLEIRSVLTLVQQQVYDQTRGKQLPYVESGLPKLFFASATQDKLPERERLLLAMADVTPAMRKDVELVAAQSDMPLAPLYAALITSDGASLAEGERRRKLEDAAKAFVKVRADLRNLASSDPQVTALRQKAEASLALGTFEEARASLTEAADIDGKSRNDLKSRFLERTLSEATTHYLSGGAARAELRYPLAIADYGKAVALYDDVAGFDLPDDARYQHVLSLELIGEMQMTVGNLREAARAFTAMEKAATSRAEADPDNVQLQRDLVVARNKVADVQLATGDYAGAIETFEQSRDAMFQIIQQDPRISYLRDLAISFNRSGDARRATGDGPGALADYRNGLKVSQMMVSELPDDDGFRRDLGVSHSKVGLALRMTNDLEGALAEFELALSISETLAAKSPDDIELQRDLTVGLNSIGDVRRLMGDNQGSFDPYRRSVAISEKLVARDPANTQWRRDLELGYGKLGDAEGEAGHLAGALEQFRSSLDIAQHLVDTDPDNAQWQRDLSIAHNKVGDVLAAQGDREAAAAEYRAGYEIAEMQHKAAPGNVQRAVDAAYSRYKLGTAGIDAERNLGDALDMLNGLKSEGRLPGANEPWIPMVEQAIAALAKQ